AKDKAHWQSLFSHFCSRTANEEEEIAHKLLGEQFRVRYLPVGDLKSLGLKYFKFASSKRTSQFFTAQQAKQQTAVVIPLSETSNLPLLLLLPLKCFCSGGSNFSVMFCLQGQLGLLHSLFKAALYDDHLSRVSMLETLIF
ncbi:hypothetical protein XENOCAPTIV_024542, partial [Xenoophorus captivus]